MFIPHRQKLHRPDTSDVLSAGRTAPRVYTPHRHVFHDKIAARVESDSALTAEEESILDEALKITSSRHANASQVKQAKGKAKSADKKSQKGPA
ncbi:hypothetical protein DIPPA_26133 [Diplonema papillatum]|nr:hypothetical protein DIPPA_26133 [Diplonema papillatum]